MKKLNYITLLFFVALAFASCSKYVWMEEVTSVGTERSEIVDGAEFNTNNDTPTNSSVSNNNRNSEGGADITDDEDDGITDDEDEDDTDQTGRKKK
jgi:PBP1b-binding outer membrane lipoprotein LpoB